jgi:hypothetical protein
MPTANITESDQPDNPGYFKEADAEAVRMATGLPIVAKTSLTKLAENLSESAHRLFCAHRWPAPSPAGVREAWTRDVEKNARWLLANFGTDPGSNEVQPPADGVAVLFLHDQPFHIGTIIPENGPEKLRSIKRIREPYGEATRLLGEMNVHDPLAGMEHWELEYLSLNAGVRSIPPEVVVAHVTLLGLAYIARLAAYAQSYYAKRKRQPKPLSPEQIFFLGLCHIYKEAFGVVPSFSTDPVTNKRGGPTIRFCQAVARQLLTYPALPDAESKTYSMLRLKLDKWAHKPGVVAERVRDALATNPGAGVFRRKRNPKRASGNEPGK